MIMYVCMYIYIYIWFLKWDTPNHPKLDHFSIETYGFGVTHFKKPPYIHIPK